MQILSFCKILMLLILQFFLLFSAVGQKLTSERIVKKNSPGYSFDYDSVKLQNIYLQYSLDTLSQYILTWKDGKFGVCDINWNLIIPNEYLYIQHYQLDEFCKNAPSYFKILDKRKKWGIADLNGKVILQPEYDQINLNHISQDSCNDERQVYAISSIQKKSLNTVFASNLKSGTQSLKYNEIFAFQDGFVFRNSNGWGFMDSNFRVLLSDQNGIPYFFGRDFAGERSVIRGIGNLAPYPYEWEVKEWMVMDKEVFIVNIENPNEIAKKNIYCLLNIKTVKSIPTPYENIFRKEVGEKHYFWCFRHDNQFYTGRWLDTLVEKYTLEIRDESFNLINQLDYGITEQDGMLDEERLKTFKFNKIRSEHQAIILSNSTLKYGIVDVIGNILVPFKYNLPDFENLNLELELTSKDSLIRAIDTNRKILLSNQISPMEFLHGFFIQQTNELWTLMDSSKKVIIDSCSDLRFVNRDSKSSWMIIKNNYLFNFKDGILTLLDSTVLNFSAPLLNLDLYLIDKSGKILAYGCQIEFINKFYLIEKCNHRKRKYLLQVLDEAGKLQFESEDNLENYSLDELTITLGYPGGNKVCYDFKTFKNE